MPAKQPQPPSVSRDDFSFDGGRIKIKSNARLMAAGYKWCAAHNGGAGAVVPLAEFRRHGAFSHHQSGYCAACNNAQKKQHQGKGAK